MLTALIIVFSVLAVGAAGEMVRTQIRRMLTQPASLPTLVSSGAAVRSPISVGSEAAA